MKEHKGNRTRKHIVNKLLYPSAIFEGCSLEEVVIEMISHWAQTYLSMTQDSKKNETMNGLN